MNLLMSGDNANSSEQANNQFLCLLKYKIQNYST